MNYIFDQFFSYAVSYINQLLLDFTSVCILLINLIGDQFWENEVILSVLSFSRWMNLIVFAVALLIMLFDLAEEQGSARIIHWNTVFLNIVKALIFIIFCQSIATLCVQFSSLLTASFQIDASVNAGGLTAQLPGASVLMNLLLFVALGVSCTAFFIMTMLRTGAIFIMILSSAFYIPDIVRGDTQKLGSWLRQLLAISFTYVFQYILFYLGLVFAQELNLYMMGVCWATMFSVPKILQHFGYSTGTKGAFGMAANIAQQGFSMLARA